VAKPVTPRKNLDECSEVFRAANDTVVDFSDLNRGCAGFDFLQCGFRQWAISSGNCHTTVFGNFDYGLSRFLNRTDVLSARTDQHSNFLRINLSDQQSWRVL
jgi:hypothetical protein